MERVHRTLKELLQKQKGGMDVHASPRDRLSLGLFTLNFLILDPQGHSAADRHAGNDFRKRQEFVKWKDVLDNQWHGPDPVIQRSRGAVCVFPQERPDPVWVPTRLTRIVQHQETKTDDGEPPTKDSDAELEDSTACADASFPDSDDSRA